MLSIGGCLDSPLLLYESLQMLLSPGAQCGSVEFVESGGTLVVKSKFLARDMTWSITMERLESTPDVKCDFIVHQVEDLNARVMDLEEKDDDDFDDNDLTARVKKLEQLLGLEKPVRAHVFRAVALPNYTLSPDRKTVSKNAGASGACQAFLSEQPITATGNAFTVLINNFGTGTNGLLAGVAKRDTNLRGGLHSKVGAYVVYLPKGSAHTFFKDGIRINCENRIVARALSRLSVRFDPTCSRLSFELDNTELLPKLEITEANASQLFPVVDLYDAEQSVSFR